jgi:predicted metal-binding membrane protein
MSGHAMPAVTTSTTGRMGVVLIAVAAAWLAAVISQWTGEAALLHHHNLIEDGPPLWIAVGLFLAGWQVMLAAMMLPASLPTIRVVDAAIGHRATFMLAFAAIWSVFGLVAFAGDFVLHHVVDATPWLAARPWLIEAGVLGMAGVYQLSPFKRRSLTACRHPVDLLATQTHRSRAFDLGVAHGLDCLGSSWALMLVMFAEGFANLGWMAALTGVMVYETASQRGQRAALAVGVVLLAFSVGTLVAG